MADKSDNADELERESLHFAAQDGDLPRVQELLQKGFDPNRFDDLGKTPLIWAAEKGHTEIVKTLLRAGAHVNAHDERQAGNTALNEIAATCTYEMAETLIRAGADPTIPGGMQLTALHKAEKRKRGEGPRVYKLLLEVSKRYRGV